MAAGWGLASLTAPGDAFRGTLAILPAVVAALRAIERHAAARRTPVIESAVAAVVLAVLVAATLARARLGLAATDWFLAAGFLLLLGQRTARLLLALRPKLGRELPRRPSAAFFWLPFVVYVAIQPWSAGHRQPDGDEPFYLLVAHSLAYDFDLDLANNYQAADWRRFMKRAVEPQPGDPVGAAGEQFSRHSFLLPLALAPAYRLAGRAGAMTVMAALTAALAWMFLRLAHRYTPERPGAALLAFGILAFCPPLLLYSGQIWVEVPAALLLALAVDRLWVLRRAERWTPGMLAALALAVALLPVLKMRFALLVPPFVWLVWRQARGSRGFARAERVAIRWALGALAAVAAGLVAYNVLRFGNPLRIYSWRELNLLRYTFDDYARGALGMFYDSAFGLFPNAPIWLLLLPAIGLAAWRRGSALSDAATIMPLYLLLIAPRIEWFGGWSPPFRYPLVCLPLLALALVPVLARRRRPLVGFLIAAAASATLVLTVLWVVIPGWTYNFADGRTHLLDEASARLGADVARFFPSTVRPRPATWWWLAGSLALIPLARAGRRGRRPRTWGVAAVLLALAALPAATRTLPSRAVDFEDAFVAKWGGAVYPEPWVLQRPAYRGGWTLVAGGGLVAPVVAGGERVTIRLAFRRLDARAAGRVWVGAGETRLADCPVGDGDDEWWTWREVELGPFDWPAGAPLVIRGDDVRGSSVVVDRADLEWH